MGIITNSNPHLTFIEHRGKEYVSWLVVIAPWSSSSPRQELVGIYYTNKNKRTTPDRLEFRKYDPKIRKHVLFKESK